MSEPTVQEEDVGEASQASGSVTGDKTAGDESDGDGAADEPAVSFRKSIWFFDIPLNDRIKPDSEPDR